MSFITAAGRDYLLGLATKTEEPVENYYVALCFSEPGFAMDGAELDEVEALGYARGELSNIGGNWQVLHGSMANLISIGFPVAQEDWGLIRNWALTDDPLAGRVLWAGDFIPTYISEDDQLDLPPYGLSVFFEEER